MRGLTADKRQWFGILIVTVCLLTAVETYAVPTATISGTPTSPTRSTGASLAIGGFDVVAYKYRLDFWISYSAEAPVSKTINLSDLPDGQRTLYVIGKDSAGNWQAGANATIKSWTVDTTAPVLTVYTLSDGAGTGNSPINIAGSVADENGVNNLTLTINGTAVSINPDGTFSHALSLNAGANVITTVTTDLAGNWTSDKRTVTLDLTPPTLVIIIPADNSVTNKSSMEVTGTVGEAATVEVKVNDGAAQLSSVTGGDFTVTANLIPGINTIDISATDSVGNKSTQKLTVTLDTTAPELTVSAPLDGTATKNPTLNIAGKVTDDSDVSFTINDSPVPLKADGTFSHALSLNSGANVITTVATDLAGNRTSDKRTVTLDQTGPGLEITTPTDNSMTANSFVEVTGTINETSDIEVMLENSLGTNLAAELASVNTGYNATVNLAAGLNTVHVSATDLLGNKSTTQKRTITYDNQKPSLAITYPPQDLRTNLNSMVIKGTVSDTLTNVTVAIIQKENQDDVLLKEFKALPSGQSFELEMTFAEHKVYRIIVKAADEAGNNAEVPRNIIYAEPSKGDINNDRTVDLIDALRALGISVGLVTQTDTDLLYGDVAPLAGGKPAPDGRIDVGDAVIILKIIVGLVSL
ncbi:MAG: polymorphic outer membrane [Geobacteraceae bacterium]|nr:MAG: polymorphic outer membrane [Geobacteraceae bacterium]